MNIFRERRRRGTRGLSSPPHPPLPGPDPRSLVRLHFRLQAFGLAPTPDPAQSWRYLRPLLRDQTVMPLHRLRRRGIRRATVAAVSLMVVFTSVALSAHPVRQLVVGSWVATWQGLARLAGTALDDGSSAPADAYTGLSGAEERTPRLVERGSPARSVSLDAPVLAREDQADLQEDTAATIDVLANDEAPRRAVEIWAGIPRNGSAVVNDDRTITYVPDPNFFGVDGFEYTVMDGEIKKAAHVTLVVIPVNDPPQAGDDSTTVDEDASVVVDVLANDRDVDGDELTIKPDPPTHGTLKVNKDGSLTYQPHPDFNGDDTFFYRLSDGRGAPAVVRVEIKVRPVNDNPVAEDDGAAATTGVPAVIDVLSNDQDVDKDSLTVAVATALHGDVHINPDGTLTYTSNPLFIGEDTISYTISDDAGGTDRAEVSVQVVEPTP